MVRDGADLAGVAQQAGHERPRRLRQVVAVRRVEERVATALEQRHVRVQAGPVDTLDRFRHERGVHAELLRDLLHGQPERHHGVRHGERVGVAQVDLVLRGRDRVVRVLHRHAQLLQVVDDPASEVAPDVERRQVEVRADVERLGRLRVAEQEVLDLGSDVERQAHVVRAGDRPPQDRARVALEQRALRRPDVAEHARHAGHAGPPREDLERRRVGVRDHVGLLHPGEPVDRRAVEADTFAQCLRQLLRGDRERLQEPEDVGEPQPDEPDPAFLGRPDDERANVVVHPSSRGRGRVRPSRRRALNVAEPRFLAVSSLLRTRNAVP